MLMRRTARISHDAWALWKRRTWQRVYTIGMSCVAKGGA
jgi:hypothetical protein